MRTARAYATAAVRLGVTIREQSPVEAVLAGPAPALRLREGSVLEAARGVVVAANHGTNDLLERSGHPRLPLWTMVPQVLMYQAKDEYQPRHLVSHLQKVLSVKRLADGITMISGGMRGRWYADTARGEPVDASVQESLDVAASVFPQLADGLLVTADASRPETYTPDGLPYLDFLDAGQRVFVAGGWHGHGFAIAPSVAHHVAQWLVTGHRPEVMAPFSAPGRRGPDQLAC